MNSHSKKWPLLAERLLATLESLLLTYPEGISEYDLLRKLQDDQGSDRIFSQLSLKDPLRLFQSHFVLFHVLYKLQQDWRACGLGDLTIHTLKIQAVAYTPAAYENTLLAADLLAEYYLDWQNLLQTTAEDVDNLFDDFWQCLSKDKNGVSHQRSNETAEQLLLSYAALNLPVNASLADVKQQYHKLLHQYHPDKGGHTCDAQKVQVAYAYIRRFG
ncbi:DNA-J related domain-containing protein [Paraglaciecola polaris]|uniref:DNA-J related domain-containing protein n=1 Tax=Paraglaciecola polaris TaxID=222814 RepID=UPI0030EC5EE5|tara:strand:+ start:25542 stop:26189 length:648 start_codon:yes stop_codon:yes gene_type:complete